MHIYSCNISIYPSIYLLSIYLSNLPIYVSVSIYQIIYPSYPVLSCPILSYLIFSLLSYPLLSSPIYLSTYLPIYLSDLSLPSIHLSIHPNIHPSIHPSSYLAIYQSIYQSINLAIYLSAEIKIWPLWYLTHELSQQQSCLKNGLVQPLLATNAKLFNFSTTGLMVWSYLVRSQTGRKIMWQNSW